jgi:hypothetical protein
MELGRKIVAGGIAIGIITAFGLHAKNLSTLSTSVGTASQGLVGTLETGGPNAKQG